MPTKTNGNKFKNIRWIKKMDRHDWIYALLNCACRRSNVCVLLFLLFERSKINWFSEMNFLWIKWKMCDRAYDSSEWNKTINKTRTHIAWINTHFLLIIWAREKIIKKNTQWNSIQLHLALTSMRIPMKLLGHASQYSGHYVALTSI